MDTPDLCTSSLVYVAAGLLTRIHSRRATPRIFILFGAVLGIAYFSKTVMFLVAFAFLVAAGWRRGTGIALASFVVVVAPWIIILSLSVGHVTYGDAGPANYMNLCGAFGYANSSPSNCLSRSRGPRICNSNPCYLPALVQWPLLAGGTSSAF